MEIKLSNLYWVIHTIQTRYSNGLVDTIHTKQVMRETWQDGKITEEPLSDKYIITGEYTIDENGNKVNNFCKISGKKLIGIN